MTATLVPIFICVVLPLGIVLIVFLASMNSDNKRASILIKAIEANNGIDADKLAESLRNSPKTAREILNLRLLRGCMFSLIGLGLLIVSIVNYANGIGIASDSVTVPMIFGGASLAVGISYLIVYFVTRKQIADSSEEK